MVREMGDCVSKPTVVLYDSSSCLLVAQACIAALTIISTMFPFLWCLILSKGCSSRLRLSGLFMKIKASLCTHLNVFDNKVQLGVGARTGLFFSYMLPLRYTPSNMPHQLAFNYFLISFFISGLACPTEKFVRELCEKCARCMHIAQIWREVCDVLRTFNEIS